MIPLWAAGDPPEARCLYVVVLTGLGPDRPCLVTARGPDGDSATAASRTLPSRVAAGKPFTISLASCFDLAHGGGVASIHPPQAHRTEADPVRLRFLAGDQIYMDIRPTGGLKLTKPKPWERNARQWSDSRFADLLVRSPTVVMADDHEFWNDYPHGRWPLWAENGQGGPLGRSLDRAFALFQGALNLDPEAVASDADIQALLADDARTFQIDAPPLRFVVLDTRTARSRLKDDPVQFTRPAWLQKALAWIAALEGPGVLLVSQPLVSGPGSWKDAKLPDYDDDFAALWSALSASRHDVLVMTGDIHWSRLHVPRSIASPAIYELASSPSSHIFGTHSKAQKEPVKVTWNGGAATFQASGSTNAWPTLATVTFTPLTDAPSTPVRARVVAWGVEEGGSAAVPLFEHVIESLQ